MHSFGKMLKALPGHSRDRSKSRDRGKSPGREAPVESEIGATTQMRKRWDLAPPKTETIITIRPTDRATEAGNPKVEVSCSKLNFSERLELTTSAYTPELSEDIRWFIEDFHRIDVLDREKALNTRISIRKYCEKLITELKLDELVGRLTGDLNSLTPIVFIQIEDSLSITNNLYRLPWEILEHPSLWPDESKFTPQIAKNLGLDLCVRRRATATKNPASQRVSKRESGVYKFEVGFSIGTIRDQYPTYNILIISSRNAADDHDRDNHFQLPRALYAALAGVDEGIHINVEICRPGTWSALQRYIGNRRKGFWNVVHIDLTFGLGSLHFLPENSFPYDPVPDWEVAELLHKHDVSTVFLTCNDNRADNPQALAETFVAEGIPVVASAPYSLPKIYMMLMSSGFYQSILALHGKGPSFAAHTARKALQSQEIEHLGRYLIPVKNTIEGLALVVYDQGSTDGLDISQYRYPVTEKTPRIFGSTKYQEVWLFGRDLDIMRMENRLLKDANSNILWLTGKRHVGKTYLLNYLTWWWQLSKFVQTSVFIDLAQCLDDFAGVLLQFATILPTVGLGETPSEKSITELKTTTDVKRTKLYKDMVKLGRTHRLYMFFDNVDAWRPVSLDRTPQNETNWKYQKKLFLDFVEEIRGGLSFVVLVCPWNDRSIRGSNFAHIIKTLKNNDVQQMFGITEWDKWVEGTGSISQKQTMLQQETTREITEYHDAVLGTCQGLIAVRPHFVYNLPFNAEQRTRDIFVLLHSCSPGVAGPYNVENSPSVMHVEGLYDKLIRDRTDIEDKNPDANVNLLRLMYSLSTFFHRVPKDISFYLVLLWHYGLFTSDWTLPGDKYDHSNEDRDTILSPQNMAEAAAAISNSPIMQEWNRMMKILVEYDYASTDPQRPDEYWILDPSVTFCTRKIVYASEGPLTVPILQLAIRYAAQDYHLHRYMTLDYTEEQDSKCRMMMEKHTLWSMLLTTFSEEGTSMKSLYLMSHSPFRTFYAPKLSQLLTKSDERVNLLIATCMTNVFDVWVKSSAPDMAAKYETQTFYDWWRLVYTAAERLAIYHNGTSCLADHFDDAVMAMRRCKAFGRRYDEARRRENEMDAFDDSLTQAELIREDLIGMGVLKDNAQNEDGQEPPPAYVAGDNAAVTAPS